MEASVISGQVCQPRLLSFPADNKLTVVIAGLALGGAEKMVLDWARRIYPKWRVRLIVLRDHPQEWTVSPHVKVIRLHNKSIISKLKRIGKDFVTSTNSAILCHLLREEERVALAHHGATVIPVLQNAKQGWLESASALKAAPYVISVSQACKQELEESEWKGVTSVIRHIPSLRNFSSTAREDFRSQWNIPLDAKVVGMIGAVKPQKNYSFAIQILRELNKIQPVYLVILGGPIGKNGRSAWETLVTDVYLFGMRQRVAMPGFIPDAMKCLPAFDVVLNTSHYEGFSMAITEALIHGVSVVAGSIGGQGEMLSEGLSLMEADSTSTQWASVVQNTIGKKYPQPSWSVFPSYRLWTLASLAGDFKPSEKTLFITANLNSGGAQRSLVHLTTRLQKMVPLEIAVTGNSSADYFFNELLHAGVSVFRTDETRDAFDHAEMLVKKIVSDKIGTVCFWNLDSKIKLLLVKTLQFTGIRFIDVSPGDNSFDELNSTLQFQHMIAFDEKEYYTRLNKIVLKYNGPSHELCANKTVCIKNGIPVPDSIKKDYGIVGVPRIVVNGRITPNKFVKEIIQSMEYVWKSIPNAQLHIYGASETKVADYAAEVSECAKPYVGSRIFFHGMTFNIQSELHTYDAYVVLGKDQGCPNALLEALAVGLPAVGNDNGGTREQIIGDTTGILISSCEPSVVGASLVRLLSDRTFAKKLGQAARKHVLAEFSIEQMVHNYFTLLVDTKPRMRRSTNKKVFLLNSIA